MNTHDPPSEADWGDPGGDLDRAYALKMFAGKTYEEARRMFETTDVLSRLEDLGNMPDVPFRFYVLAFRDFLLSPVVFEIDMGVGAPTAASGFLILVESVLRQNPVAVRPILDELLSAAEYVCDRQVQYDADEDIYGRFPDALRRIKALAADV